MKEYGFFLEEYLSSSLGITGGNLAYTRLAILLLTLVIICFIVQVITKKVLHNVVGHVVKRTRTEWDDIFYERSTFAWLANIIPALIVRATTPFVFKDFPDLHDNMGHLIAAFIVIVVVGAANSVIESIRDIMLRNQKFRDKPIASYIQLGKIILYFIGGILVISILLGKSPGYFLGAMGAVSAVLLLVFKDTILGFVASIHISVNDMVRVGDWVSMEKYGADGDVLEINLATVKVKNWDLTITTIPTYALVSDSFKNWRGMTESEGRRIKRAVYINVDSIKHANAELLEKLHKIAILRPFLENKEAEIQRFNSDKKIPTDHPANGRRLTNIGIFRYYLELFVKNNENIHPDMTLMVRQLAPTPNGLPLEIYAFSKDKRWVHYEAIMSDIFDHVYAIAPFFDITFFQNPSGRDFQELNKLKSHES